MQIFYEVRGDRLFVVCFITKRVHMYYCYGVRSLELIVRMVFRDLLP